MCAFHQAAGAGLKADTTTLERSLLWQAQPFWQTSQEVWRQFVTQNIQANYRNNLKCWANLGSLLFKRGWWGKHCPNTLKTREKRKMVINLSKSEDNRTRSSGCETIKRGLGKEKFQTADTKCIHYGCKVDSSLLAVCKNRLNDRAAGHAAMQVFMESRNHCGWKGSPRSLSPTTDWSPPCQLWMSATSRGFLNTSRNGHSSTSLGSPLQCLTTLSVKKYCVIIEFSGHLVCTCNIILIILCIVGCTFLFFLQSAIFMEQSSSNCNIIILLYYLKMTTRWCQLMMIIVKANSW